MVNENFKFFPKYHTTFVEASHIKQHLEHIKRWCLVPCLDLMLHYPIISDDLIEVLLPTLAWQLGILHVEEKWSHTTKRV